MTMQITPARPSLAMYGKTLSETTAIKDWMMRRVGQTAIPPSSLVRRHAPTISGLGAAGERGPFPGQGPGPKRWPIAPHGTRPGSVTLGDTTHVQDWNDRRIWKKRIPASSLMGLGELGRHVGTKAERTWGVNPLSGQVEETTYVRDTYPRRVGKHRWEERRDHEWHEQASVSGFGSFGVIDSTVSVRDLQTSLRKMGICQGGGHVMVIDGIWGPITQGALVAAVGEFSPGTPTAGLFSGSTRATTIGIASSIWTRIQELAAGRVDSCSGSAGARTDPAAAARAAAAAAAARAAAAAHPADAVAAAEATRTAAAAAAAAQTDPGTSFLSNPLVWLGAVALAGVAYYTYSSGGETPSYDEDGMPSSVTFPI